MAKTKNYVWCVDTGSSVYGNGMIHSKLFLSESEARAYYEANKNPHWFCEISLRPDIWNFTERETKRHMMTRTEKLAKALADAGYTESQITEIISLMECGLTLDSAMQRNF